VLVCDPAVLILGLAPVLVALSLYVGTTPVPSPAFEQARKNKVPKNRIVITTNGSLFFMLFR